MSHLLFRLGSRIRQISSVPSVSTDAIKFLDTLTNYEKGRFPKHTEMEEKFPLERMKRLLKKIGDPQTQLRSVHVVGSKGKGSICSFLSSILSASSCKVGRMLSPHISQLSERISLSSPISTDGSMIDISPESLESLILNHKSIVQELVIEGGHSPSYFEFLTALSFLHFVQSNAHFAIVESGLGGIHDATNALDEECLDLTIVAPIEKEHIGPLGDNLEEIIDSEIGVIRPKKTVLIAQQSSEFVRERIIWKTKELNCNAAEVMDSISVSHVGYDQSQSSPQEVIDVKIRGQLIQSSQDLIFSGIRSQMLGRHQHENMKTAILASLKLRDLGWPINEQVIGQGIQDAFIPARFQVFRPDSLSEWIVLDGAHTKESATALASSIRDLFPTEALVFVLCMARDKQHEDFLSEIMEAKPDGIVFTKSTLLQESGRLLPPGTLLALWEQCEMNKRFRCRKTITVNLSTALVKAQNEVRGVPKSSNTSSGVICVTGSFYTIAEAKDSLNNLTF
eukprot:g286.t1